MAAEALHLELLHACPSACLACDHRSAGQARLSADALGPLFCSPRFKDLRLVSFSGGEPLLHPELGAIIEKAGAAFPAAALVLLSSLYDGGKALALLRSLPPRTLTRLHLGSSLDGPAPLHDKARGRPGAFAALAGAHAAIKKEFPRLSTGFTFTATRLNAGSFYETWLEAKKLGAPLGLQFLVPNANTTGLELRAADKKALTAGLKAVLAKAPSANLAAALDFLAGKPAPGPCGAGTTFYLLAPEGLFYLCPFHKDIIAPPGGEQTLRRRLPPASPSCGACFLRCAR
ncbi:MAG: hypothetical protein PHV33_03345 [Elusimicrobiales bacterium]|nr:hypothetical protein [Elusimicrobiales bacterium]